MHITIKEATITIDSSEANSLYFDIKRSLEHSIETHWVRYPEVFDEQARTRFNMLRHLARVNGKEVEHDIKSLRDMLARLTTKKTL